METKLEIALAVLQKFGREGTIIFDRLWKERPAMSKDAVLVEVGERLKDESDVTNAETI